MRPCLFFTGFFSSSLYLFPSSPLRNQLLILQKNNAAPLFLFFLFLTSALPAFVFLIFQFLNVVPNIFFLPLFNISAHREIKKKLPRYSNFVYILYLLFFLFFKKKKKCMQVFYTLFYF